MWDNQNGAIDSGWVLAAGWPRRRALYTTGARAVISNMRTVQKKVCMLGDFAVGKTSTVQRFVEGIFDDRYLSTIGVKINRKQLTVDDYVATLLIWDLAGGDDFVSHAKLLAWCIRCVARL